MSTQTIESVLNENRTFPPPAEFVKKAAISGMDAYNALCAEAERDFIVAEQAHRDDADQHGGSGIDQIVAKQDHAQQAVGLREQLIGDARAAMALAHQGFEAIAVQRHHARLGNREKSRQQQQQGEYRKLNR